LTATPPTVAGPALAAALEPAPDDLPAWLALADPERSASPALGERAARRAAEIARTQGRAFEQARAGAWLCAQLFRLGRLRELQREADPLLPRLAGAPLQPERCETLRLLTLAGCETGDYEIALDAAHRLASEAAELADDGLALTAAFCLAACFERMGDSWQAMRLLHDAVENHSEHAPARPRLIAQNGLCAIAIGTYHRLRDAAPESERAQVLTRARQAGDAARALLPHWREPVYEAAVLGNLGEVLLHQGDWAPSHQLLLAAKRVADERGLVAHGWRIQASLGDWSMAQGQATDALADMLRLLAAMGADAPLPTEVRARDCAYRACRQLGRLDEALHHFEIVERLERRRTVGQLRAQSELFVTRIEAQRVQEQAELARRDADRQRERAAEYALHAERDPLTGLGNRRHFERRMGEILPAGDTAAVAGRELTLVMLDIDHFKAINDRHGHAAGDSVLVGLAQMLRENMRSDDVLARLGGEEFVLVLPGMAPARAAEVCERLRERLAERPWPSLPPRSVVTASLGLAGAPPHDTATLLARADAALYEAKRGGRNRVCVAP
jgi:diguanylate cyclase